jgi:hypothetical protein
MATDAKTDATLKALDEQSNILAQKARDARTAALAAKTDEEYNKYQAERESYRKQLYDIAAQKEVVSKQDPATSIYSGVDQNSGRQRYYNPVLGTYYLSDVKPEDAQKQKLETDTQQSGAPVDPATSANATPPAVAKADIPVDISTSSNTAKNPYAGAGAAPPAQPVEQQTPPSGDGTAVVTPQVPIAQSAMNQVDTPLLTPAESIAKAQKQPEAVDPAVAAANFNSATNQSILSAIAPASQNQSEAETARLARAGNTGVSAPPSTVNLPPEIKFSKAEDWRVRLTLAPGSKYFYNAEDPGILEPLIATNGVIFPYSPTIQMAYKANYETTDVTHSNYKLHFYKNSSIEDISITAEFTAQDTVEANYLLAVLHFFKTATKMFYGQDVEPKPGTPPPLLYLSGFGTYQYDNHPLVLTNFAYTLPNDVDYIRAGVSETWAGSSISTLTGSNSAKAPTNPLTGIINKFFRIQSNGLSPGGQKPVPTFKSLSNKQATYVPSKLQITLTLSPMVTRKDISQNFSLQKYATGELLQGSKRQGGGIW